jgi:hypothetical protein
MPIWCKLTGAGRQSGNGTGLVGGSDGSCLAFSWAGIGWVAGGDGGCLLESLSWAGTGGVAGGGGFLFGTFFWVIDRAPKFWKYKAQVVDSCKR